MPTRDAVLGDAPLVVAVDPLKCDYCSVARSGASLSDPALSDDLAVLHLEVPPVSNDNQSENQGVVAKKGDVGTSIRDYTNVRIPTYVSLRFVSF